MKEPIYEYDPAAALTDPESIAIFMSDAFETGDASYIAKALGVVARAKGMTQLAKETGVSREGLYKALSSDGNPEFSTVLKVIKALGLTLHATA